METMYYFPNNNNKFSEKELIELKELYDEAVYAYYSTDETIIPDLQFDELKEILEDGGYDLSSEEEVESDNIREKLMSENNMISLKKVQVFSKTMELKHVQSVIDWLKQYDSTVNIETSIAIGWKLDGCASKLIYDDNKQLCDVITRGNFSIKKKMLEIAKKQHPTIDNGNECRCEILMKKTTFIDKSYNENYANPRNLVSGIINDINIDDQRKNDITFMKINDGLNHNSLLDDNKNTLSYTLSTINELPFWYDYYLKSRESLEYPTDGLVIYLNNVQSFENIGKYPLHCIAVKFPPVEAITTVHEIQWNLKKSGEWIPKVLLEPVDLDGSIVKQSLVFNIGYVRANGIYPGARVVIAKNGDIIPYIQRVISTGDESKANFPKNTIEIGKHLYPKDSQDIIDRERFISGCYCLGIKNFGYSWFRGLSTICNNDIVNLFNSDITNINTVQQLFSGAKKPKAFIESLNQVKQQVTIYRLLRYLQIPKLGPATAKQLARSFSGLEFSTFGLEKSVVNDCLSGNSYTRITEAMNSLNEYGVNIELIKEENKTYSATFEMTGSPKGFGISSKDEFCKMVSNWEHTKLEKATTYLITDDTTSTTGKMAKAKKFATKVITYSEAIELYGKNN